MYNVRVLSCFVAVIFIEADKSKSLLLFCRQFLRFSENVCIFVATYYILNIQIAREVVLKPIADIASGLNIDQAYIEPYGKYIAKVPYTLIDEAKAAKSHLILVTAITPTKAGIGKTTVSVWNEGWCCRRRICARGADG